MNNNYIKSNYFRSYPLYEKDSVVQKIISKEAYDILMICKKCGSNSLENIQNYILKVYGNKILLNDYQLYNYLVKIVLEIFDEKELQHVLSTDINSCFKRKEYGNYGKHLPIDYNDLSFMFAHRISLIQVKEKIDDNIVDIFLVDYNNEVITSSEYEKTLKLKKN